MAILLPSSPALRTPTPSSHSGTSSTPLSNELNAIIEPAVPSIEPRDGKEDGLEGEDEEASEEAWEDVGEGSIEGSSAGGEGSA